MPNRCCHDGPTDAVNVCASGSAGAISGANTASTIQAATITRPTTASGWRRPGWMRRAVVGERPRRTPAVDVTRIRGSMTPYRMSTMKFTVT